MAKTIKVRVKPTVTISREHELFACRLNIPVLVINKLIDPILYNFIQRPFLSYRDYIAIQQTQPQLAKRFYAGFQSGACRLVTPETPFVIYDILGNYKVPSTDEILYYYSDNLLSIPVGTWRVITNGSTRESDHKYREFRPVFYPKTQKITAYNLLAGTEQDLNISGIEHATGDVLLYDNLGINQSALLIENGLEFSYHFESNNADRLRYKTCPDDSIFGV